MAGTIMGMFGPSPIRPLQKHVAKAFECTEQLQHFFTAVFKEDWSEVEKIQEQVVALENEADDLKKDLRLHLPNKLFMPFPRTDVLELLSAQDGIANRAKDIAGLILGRKMIFPAKLQDDMMMYLKRSIDAAEQATQAINELDELLETGFRGKEVDIVENMILKLNEIEHDTDGQQIKIRRALYELEKEIPPVDVIFLYKIVDWIGDLADRAQKVGSKLQMLLAG